MPTTLWRWSTAKVSAARKASLSTVFTGLDVLLQVYAPDAAEQNARNAALPNPIAIVPDDIRVRRVAG